MDIIWGHPIISLPSPIRSDFDSERKNMSGNAWLFWALASAGFASLTAIFAKMGLQGIDSDFATFIRTLVILAALVLFLTYTSK